LPRFYFDWELTRKAQQMFDAAFTPAVSLVLGLDVALGLLLEQGLDAAFDRHVRLGRACREGIKAMGLELFSPDDDSAAVVTAVRAPEGIDAVELLLLLRDRHGGRMPRAACTVTSSDACQRGVRNARNLAPLTAVRSRPAEPASADGSPRRPRSVGCPVLRAL